jgi:cellulose 1,4-beta-cellobiosidase
MTVVTRFHRNQSGTLAEIKRFYVQDGKVIHNAKSHAVGMPSDSINPRFCVAQLAAFGDGAASVRAGGLAQMGKAMKRGMVLAFSLWDDVSTPEARQVGLFPKTNEKEKADLVQTQPSTNMHWLDSTFPTNSSEPGASRGPCPTTGGAPVDIEALAPNSSVAFSNLRFGPIGSTFDVAAVSSSTSAASRLHPGGIFLWWWRGR